MKYSFLVLLSLMVFGCKQQAQKNESPQIAAGVVDTNFIKYEHKLDSIGKDSINISADPEMPIFYKTSELKDFIRHRPELISEYTEEPSIGYARKGLSPDELDERAGQTGPDYSFSSEVGQDDYYGLYAYFLRLRIGDKPFAV